MWRFIRKQLMGSVTAREAGVETRLSGGSGWPAGLGALLPRAGWWRDDSSEQLRQYQSWVYAAVHAISQEVARQRPYAYLNTGPAEHDQKPLPPTHPLCRLLDAPNPQMTAWELWYLTTVHLELAGNCYWYIATSAGLPAEIWIIPTPWVTIEPDATGLVRRYQVRVPGAGLSLFDASEMVHIKYPHPSDPYYGLSPLQANAITVDANQELLQSRYRTFQSGPRPGVVLQTDQLLNETTVRRLEEKLETRFSGTQNWHRPLILEQGLRASPWTLTPQEMDYLNSARLTRDEILAIYRVPAVLLGLIEHVGLASDIWLGARTMFCEGTLQPKLDLFGQILTRDLARRFGADLMLSFPDCSPRAQAEQRRDDETDARLGLRTINEIRRSRGLRPYADARYDRPMIHARLV